MDERHKDFWALLARPFNDAEISSVRDATRNYRYISAPVCRRRLNDVLGPGSWESKVSYADGVAVVHISVDMHGEKIVRGAIGHGEPDRPADDVAFSHAAELLGIGAYLAIDDARFVPPAASTAPAREAAPPRDERPAERDERRDDRSDDRPARDERPAQREERRPAEAYPRERGGRREQGRGPRQGGGWGSGPRPGGGVYAWVMDKEEKHRAGEGLKDHLIAWGKSQGMPKSFKEYTQEDINDMVVEANLYLNGEVAR